MLIDGKKIAAEIQEELTNEIMQFSGRKPCLAVILVGDHPPSQIYVKRKISACHSVGIHSIQRIFPSSITEMKLLNELKFLNEDPSVDGILVQLPLPVHISPFKIMHAIYPEKDVDGFHPINMGKLLIGEKDGFAPCTPLGIKVLLERYSLDTDGKNVVILGRGNLVGKPMSVMLMQNVSGANATVTVVHSRSKNIPEICQKADILIAAIGSPKFVTADMVKDGVVVVDVGINKVLNPALPSGYQIVGDVDFDAVADKCSHITPVPGGVGPMTIAMLLSNTIKSYKQRYL